MGRPGKASDDDDGEEVEEEQFDSDDDASLDDDLEALRRACMLSGTDPNNFPIAAVTSTASAAADADSDSDLDDLELVRNIQRRFPSEPLSLKPISSIPPAASDEEDDFETLRVIQRRFVAYGGEALGKSSKNNLQAHEQIHAPSMTLENETSCNLVVNKTSSCKGCPDLEDACNANENLKLFGNEPSGDQPFGYIEWNQSDVHEPLKYSSFPKPAQLFIDAIKKNRSCQKFLRSKMVQIEAKLEENKKMLQRVKLLKNFKVSCRRRTGRALSQKKDAHVQLISVPKRRGAKISKVNDKKVSAMWYGPAENSHVANYRMVLEKFPISLSRKKWSDKERENLEKGMKQQYQEMLLQMSVDLFSGSYGSFGDIIDVDDIMSSIADFKITPEYMNLFLPKVNWEELASKYVMGRSGAECEARWLNWENPLINHTQWTNMEDKNLLLIIQQKGFNNWIDIASLLQTNRTPFQCLARFQRSLNASIMKRDWTDEDDAELRKAVETFGEGDWQLIASTVEGRTGTQCSNRWKKSLHPTRQRVGRWSGDEDKRLKVAVMLFGPKTWNKIAQFVPGRTQVQCRERWVNSLDPSLNLNKWTADEDLRLKAAITEHGYCWSKVAACVPPRTDNQCWRRWKLLFPQEVPLLQAARKIQKAALISNFVDRESERPALGPNDFRALPAISEAENSNSHADQNAKSQGKRKRKDKHSTSWIKSKGSRKEAQNCSDDVLMITNCDEVGSSAGGESIYKKRRTARQRSRMNKRAEPNPDPPSLCPDSTLLITNGKQIEEVGVCGGDTTKDKSQDSGCNSRGGLVLKSQRETKSCYVDNKHVEHQQDHLSVCQESALLMTTNVEGIETYVGDDATRKKKAPKSRSKRNKYCEIGDIPKEKRVTKQCSRKNNFAEPKENPSMLMITNGEFEGFGVEDAAEKEKATKAFSRTSKCSDAETVAEDAAMKKRVTEPHSEE